MTLKAARGAAAGSSPYLAWAANEGVPIHDDFGVDLLTAKTGAWPRLGDGCNGCFVHLKGRGNWMTVFLFDIPPAGTSAPQRHVYDELFYVLSGHGSVVVDCADGTQRSFEWGPRSMFALPLNMRYRIFNGSGREPARIASANNMALIMNIFHNEHFIFDNRFAFAERECPAGFYSGNGELTAIRPGRNLWETNLVSDLGAFELMPLEARGAGSSNMQFLLAEGSNGAHTSEMPVGTYKKAHHHGPGLHIFFVHGTGYTLLWYRGDKDFKRVDWRHGMLFAPPEGMFHQHFNTGSRPARYLAVGLGSKRYPIVHERRVGSETRRTDVSIKDGGSQIEYQDQDPRIHALWLQELRRTGATSRMGKYFDESQLAEQPPA